MRAPQWVPSFALDHFAARLSAFDPGTLDRLGTASSAGEFLGLQACSPRDPLLVDWIELYLCLRLIQGEEFATTWRRLEKITDARKFADFMRRAAVDLAYVLLSQSRDHRRDARSRFVLKLSDAAASMLGSEERGIVCDLTIVAFGRSLDRKRVRAVCRSAQPASGPEEPPLLPEDVFERLHERQLLNTSN